MHIKALVLVSLLVMTDLRAGVTNTPVFGVVLIPPYTQLNSETDKCEGETIDRTLQIMQEYDLEPEVMCLPAPRFYQYFARGKIDFTINIKSSAQLAKHVTFLNPPFRKMQLNLYSRLPSSSENTIATVAGYNYGGIRDKLSAQAFDLLDFPSAHSSLQAFVRKRSDRVIFYHPQMDYYLGKGIIKLDDSIKVEQLSVVHTYFAIANHSDHFETLNYAITDYAVRMGTRFFIDD